MHGAKGKCVQRLDASVGTRLDTTHPYPSPQTPAISQGSSDRSFKGHGKCKWKPRLFYPLIWGWGGTASSNRLQGSKEHLLPFSGKVTFPKRKRLDPAIHQHKAWTAVDLPSVSLQAALPSSPGRIPGHPGQGGAALGRGKGGDYPTCHFSHPTCLCRSAHRSSTKRPVLMVPSVAPKHVHNPLLNSLACIAICTL